MCCGAMLSNKESVRRLRKSKKNNATKEHPVSLAFTTRFTTHSARDTFVIKLARHAKQFDMQSDRLQNEVTVQGGQRFL